MMTRHRTKILASIVLLFMLVLNGCSFSSLLFSSIDHESVFSVEYPPNRVTVNGDMSEEEHKLLLEVMKELSKRKYRAYHYNSRPGFNLDADVSVERQLKTKIDTSIKRRIK